MEMRVFGRTGMRVSILGFGCGAVGGLMVRGDPADQERAVARALEAGVNYFDTAVRTATASRRRTSAACCKKLKPPTSSSAPRCGSGRRLRPHRRAVAESLEASLQRLGPRAGRHLPPAQCDHETAAANRSATGVLDEVVPAFEKLRQQGKTRFLGITAVGDTAALHQVIDSRRLRQRPGQLQPAESVCSRGAAGGLSGAGLRSDVRPHPGCRRRRRRHPRACRRRAERPRERHPIASPPPEPIGSAIPTMRIWSARGGSCRWCRGYAGSLPEAAVRFAITHPAMGTILVGMATPQEFEEALAAVKRVRCRRPRWRGSLRCGRCSRARRDERRAGDIRVLREPAIGLNNLPYLRVVPGQSGRRQEEAMTYGTRTDHYPATSKLLHWLVAACVLTTAPVAICDDPGGPGSDPGRALRLPQIDRGPDPGADDAASYQSAGSGRADC